MAFRNVKSAGPACRKNTSCARQIVEIAEKPREMPYNPSKHGGASRRQYEKGKNAQRHVLIEASPGDVVEIVPGAACKIVRKVVGYDEASLAAIRRSEEAQAQKVLEHNAKYDKSSKRAEARARAIELRNADPQRLAHHNALKADYRERKRVAQSHWPFCPIDAEGVNMVAECWSEPPGFQPGDERDYTHFPSWIATTTRAWMDGENKNLARRKRPKLDWAHLNGDDWQGETCNPNSQRVWIEYVKATGYTLYMPQKLVVLAAGAEASSCTLAHMQDGLGRDASALSMVECFDFLCDLQATHPLNISDVLKERRRC
jgi:hypothetical protein